jgi:hypothetical protein
VSVLQWKSTSEEAHSLVFGDRQSTYNHPAVDYSRVAQLFDAMTGIELSLRETVAFMLCVKLSRVSNALHQDFPASVVRDSIVDLAGYGDCLFAVWEAETEDALDDILDDVLDDFDDR